MTVKAFEAQGADAKTSTMLKMMKAVSTAGVEFTSDDDDFGAGVRFRRPQKYGGRSDPAHPGPGPH